MPILNMVYSSSSTSSNIGEKPTYLSVAITVNGKHAPKDCVITAISKNDNDIINFATDENGIATTELEYGEYELRFQKYTGSISVKKGEISTYVFKIETSEFNFGIKIPFRDSKPNCGEYIEDCAGFVNANNTDLGSWTNWMHDSLLKSIKPCVLKADGTVNYYLDKQNRTKKVDGTPAVLTGADGDVMVEIPKLYWYMHKDSTYQYIYLSNYKVNNNYQCLAHTKGTRELDKIYVSSYLGFNDAGKLRSISGKLPTVPQTIGVFRTQAQSRANWQQMDFHTLTLLQILYLMIYKNRDSKTQLGKGYTATTNTALTNTGGTNSKSWCFGYEGENDGKQQNCFLGIEDFFGNCRYWIDGLFYDANRNILTSTQNYNDTGSGYTNNGASGYTANFSGPFREIQGINSTGFLPKGTLLGSNLTYYTDSAGLSASSLPYFGGAWNFGANAGAFRLDVNGATSTSVGNISARCVYKG